MRYASSSSSIIYVGKMQNFLQRLQCNSVRVDLTETFLLDCIAALARWDLLLQTDYYGLSVSLSVCHSIRSPVKMVETIEPSFRFSQGTVNYSEIQIPMWRGNLKGGGERDGTL